MRVQKSGGSGSPNYTKPSTTSSKSPVATPSARTGPASTLSLAEEISEPIDNLGQVIILLYGEKKIGKTSLASKFPKAHFFMFEPGGKGLRIRQKPVTSWAEWKQYVRLLKADSSIDTVIVDTVDIAYDLCFAYVCKQMAVDHPSEGDFGNVWDGIAKEFKAIMNELIATGKGVIFISHAGNKEFLSRSGSKYDKLVPSLKKQAWSFMSGVADLIGYYGYYGTQRYLTLQGSDAVEAGSRLEERFLAKDGTRVHSIPMGSSSNEAYDNFVAAFNNEQETSGEPEANTGLSDVQAKPGKRR